MYATLYTIATTSISVRLYSYLDGGLHDHVFRHGCGHDSGRLPLRSGDRRACALRSDAHPPLPARGQNHCQTHHPLNKQRKTIEGFCRNL